MTRVEDQLLVTQQTKELEVSTRTQEAQLQEVASIIYIKIKITKQSTI